MDAFDALEQVQDMDTLFAFVRALIQDRQSAVAAELKNPSSPYGPDAGGWENVTIDQYLCAALAWAERTSMGATQGIAELNTWRAFASFLYVGKIHE